MHADENDPDTLRARIIGLGEKSIHKSYYPELKHRLAELERFRSMLDQSSEIIFLVNFPDFLIYDVTSPVKAHLGWTQEELVGSCFWDLIEPVVGEAMRSRLSDSWHGGREREVFTSLVRGDIPLEFVCSPVQFEGQKYVIIVAQEIRKRLMAEQQIRRQLFQLDTLHKIDNLITANLPLHDLLNGVLDEVRNALRADAAAIFVFDSPDVLRCIAWSSHDAEMDQMDLQIPWMQLPSLEYGQRVVFHLDEEKPGNWAPMRERLERRGFQSYAGEPLSTHGQTKGILEVFYREKFQESDEWAVLFSRLSAQVMVAVEKSQLFNNLQTAYVELNRAYDETLEGWAAALDLREKETANHSREVVELTIRLAHAVGIKSSELVHIRRGAYLHDIGKMGVPDAILLKPGPLTDEEWVVMRQHPIMAYQVLSKITYLLPALDIPYAHHEKWDGTGYPRGLKGEEIPLAARVFAVVDVWQALTSDRVYRKAWPVENATQYIIDHSGTHFDPRVVEAFLANI